MEYVGTALPPPAHLDGEKDDHPIASQEADHTPTVAEPTPTKLARKPSTKVQSIPAMPPTPASPNDASNDSFSSDEAGGNSEVEEAAATIPRSHQHPAPRTAAILRHLHPGPSASRSGQAMPQGEGFSDDSDYFPGMQHVHAHHTHSHNHHHSSPAKTTNGPHGKSRLRASSRQRQQSKERKLARKMSEHSWMEESGMNNGARADTLGDGGETSDDAPPGGNRTASPTRIGEGDNEKSILREALKGDMIVEQSEEERENGQEELNVLDAEKKVGEAEIERMKVAERKGFGEVY